MDRIQTQASKLWDTLFDDETAKTYQEALNLTGNILKESAQLIWLVVCSFFVFGAWFSDASMKTGRSVRDWVDNKDAAIAPSPETAKIAAKQKGKSLLETSRESATALLAKAREELGLDPNAPLATPRKDSPVAKLVAPSADSDSSSLASNSSASSSVESSTIQPASSSPTPPATGSADTTDSSAAVDSHPAAGAEDTKPATSEGQEIGSPVADSRGTGAPGGSAALRDKPDYSPGGMQAGGPQGRKYADRNQDFKDDYDEEDVGEEEFAEDESFGTHADD